ncbi:MAG: hypothetical protein ACP5QZ_05500 [Candidatus Sumerlaeaceae bacterium]
MLATLWGKWKKLGALLAKLFGQVLFALLYLLLFTPVALAAKLIGKHFLPRFSSADSTYFLPKEKIEPTLDYLRRQW